MYYRAVPYHVDEKSGVIDYGELKHLAKKYRPTLLFSGATAYPRKIDFKRIGAVAKNVGSYHVADISHIAGLVAAGLHPSPFPYADVVMMTTHKILRGPRGAVIFSRNEKCKNQNGKLTMSEAIDRAVFPGLQGGPHNNVTAAIAWTFWAITNNRQRATKNSFAKYQEQVVKNAKALSEALLQNGFSLISGGTDTHLMLLDLRTQGITGSDAERALEASGILANRNTIPGDTQPFKPSGIRLGTPAVTSRGMKDREMKQIALWIKQVLGEDVNVRKDVERICKKFPLPYKM
jgi:glycine hydroxymethyltransferase